MGMLVVVEVVVMVLVVLGAVLWEDDVLTGIG